MILHFPGNDTFNKQTQLVTSTLCLSFKTHISLNLVELPTIFKCWQLKWNVLQTSRIYIWRRKKTQTIFVASFKSHLSSSNCKSLKNSTLVVCLIYHWYFWFNNTVIQCCQTAKQQGMQTIKIINRRMYRTFAEITKSSLTL